MAIITPLLDTLLHEVLGRRMDAPAKAPLNPPVAPTYPTKAAQAIQGDARLQTQGGAPRVEDALAPGRRTSPTTPPGHIARSAASAYASLSPAAQLISSVLERFPAPPSVIRQPGPLLQSPPASTALTSPAETGQSAGAQLLQTALRSAITESGLFYESHLKAWFQGRLPLENLLRQPQMQGWPTPSPAPAAASGVPRSPEGPERAAPPMPDRIEQPRRLPAERAETIQQILRHQLELLVTPVLRWEGEVWPGAFMSLILDLGRPHVDEQLPEEAEEQERSGERCQASLQLNLEGLGQVQAVLDLHDQRLALKLHPDAAPLHDLMLAAQDSLTERLGAIGFEVMLDLQPPSSAKEEDERE